MLCCRLRYSNTNMMPVRHGNPCYDSYKRVYYIETIAVLKCTQPASNKLHKVIFLQFFNGFISIAFVLYTAGPDSPCWAVCGSPVTQHTCDKAWRLVQQKRISTCLVLDRGAIHYSNCALRHRRRPVNKPQQSEQATSRVDVLLIAFTYTLLLWEYNDRPHNWRETWSQTYAPRFVSEC